MADPSTTHVSEAAQRGTNGQASRVEPLMRRNYQRLPEVEEQIGSALGLDTAELIDRARIRDSGAPDHLSAEALVYFIRAAHRRGERRAREALFRELLERCTPFFRGKFRGFSPDQREDMQGEVLKNVVEDLLAADDRGDFMQVRFWKYLERKTIDACRVASRQSADMESLEAAYGGDSESSGLTLLDTVADDRLSPEQIAILGDALSKLPARLRQVFLLRHVVGMKIGEDDGNADTNELTLARHFNCTGRTIRNWLREADKLLAGFQERQK